MFQWRDPVIPAPTCISVNYDEYGRYIGMKIGPGIVIADGVRPLTYAEHDLVMAHPERFRYDLQEIEPLIEAKLVVSCLRFVADGSDYCSVEARCDQVSTVKIRINGDEIELPIGELLFIRSTDVGAFQIQLIDPRLWAEEHTFYVMAIAAETTNGD